MRFLPRRKRRPPEPAPEAPPAAAEEPAPPAPPPAAERDERLEEIGGHRRVLIAQCIELADQIGSEVLVAQIHETLETVGVRTIQADGDQVDYRHHVSVDAEPTPDRGRDGTVAETVRVGYRDGDELIRQPEVVVYRYEGV